MTTIDPPIYEVETRFYFSNPDEVWDTLPIFQHCMNQEIEWHTVHYGPTLFQFDQILRINLVICRGKSRSLLGWKEPDQGKSVNIRVEMEEEITNGIQKSNILTRLGGQRNLNSPEAVASELARLGHPQFMAFSGKNLTGIYEPQGFHLKLMLTSDPPLRYPLLFEVEKPAKSLEEAAVFEKEILEFVHRYQLENRVVREEPPALLCQAIHLR
jgi:hypothetical protein